MVPTCCDQTARPLDPAGRLPRWLGGPLARLARGLGRRVRTPLAAAGLAAAATLATAAPASAQFPPGMPSGGMPLSARGIPLPTAPMPGGPMPGGPMPGGPMMPAPGGGSVEAMPQYPGPLAALTHSQRHLYGPMDCPQPAPPGCDPTRYEMLPPQAAFGDRPRPRVLPAKGWLSGAVLSFDYLHYDIENPEVRIVGAEQAGRDALDPFFPDNSFALFAAVPTTFDIEDMPGVRATLAVPVTHGAVELSGWGFGQTDASITQGTALRQVDGFFGSALVGPAIPLLDAGNPSNDTALLFDSLTAATKTELMGARVDYVLEGLAPEGNLLNFRPTIGFQYLRLREGFEVVGPFTPALVTDPVTGEVISPGPFERRIASRIDNHLFAPTIGLRTELGNDWLRVTAEPKLALAANRRRETLDTRNLGAIPDLLPRTPQDREDSDFDPYFELSVKGDVRLSQRVSAHVGYNLLLLSGIGRPQENLVYDSLGENGVAITLDDNQEELFVHGLFVGLDVQLGPMPQSRP